MSQRDTDGGLHSPGSHGNGREVPLRVGHEVPLSGAAGGGQHLWARGYFCASSGTVTDVMIKEYLELHEGRSPDPDFKVEVPD